MRVRIAFKIFFYLGTRCEWQVAKLHYLCMFRMTSLSHDSPRAATQRTKNKLKLKKQRTKGIVRAYIVTASSNSSDRVKKLTYLAKIPPSDRRSDSDVE